MSTQSTPLKGSGAAVLDYLYNDLLDYYDAGDSPGRRPRHLGPDDVVFRLSQVRGHAPEALGIDFGLTGGVTKAQFMAIASGSHPVTGEQLVQRRTKMVFEQDPDGTPALDDSGLPIPRRDRSGAIVRESTSHVGIDVYFAAPKTVSIARVVAEVENPALAAAIAEAHRQACAITLDQIEATALLGRRTVATPTEVGPRLVTKGPRRGQACKTQGSATERVPVQLMIFSVAQHTARPTEATVGRGAPPDMHMHQHNLIANMAWDPVAGRATAIDDFGLKAAAAKHDAWYLGNLARLLEEAGIEIDYGSFVDSDHGRTPWRVAGITPEAERFYSSNRQRAWDLAKDYEAQTGRAATPAVIRERMRGTRLAKDARAKAQDSAPVWSLWHDDAKANGIDLATDGLRRAMREPQSVAREPFEERRAELWRRLYSPKGLTRVDATFNGAGVTEAVARAGEGLAFSMDDLAHFELEMLDELVVVRGAADPRHVLYSTEVQLAMERRVDATLVAKAAASYPGVRRAQIDAAIAAQSVALDDEQQDAVRAVCSGAGAVFVEGLAGTGKTTAMRAAVQALREAGAVDQVVVVSTAALTARSSGAKLGADLSGSVEYLSQMAKVGRFRPTPRTLVVFDESAMCDTERQDRFLITAGAARVVYVGDPHQAQAIGPAGWYRDATSQLGVHLLTAVHRHSDPADVADFTKIRTGQAPGALASLALRGRVHISADRQEALARIVEDYAAFRRHGHGPSDVIVIGDAANADLDIANRQIQRWRHGAAELPRTGFEVEAEASERHWTLHQGDPVLFLRSYGRGRDAVANGTTGVITDLDTASGRAHVRLGGARKGDVVTVDLMARDLDQPLGLAYAVHAQKYQGGEAPVVLMLPGTPGQSDKFSAYSTLTRSTLEAHVYPDRETHGAEPVESLGKAWSQGSEKRSARDVAGEVTSQPGPTAPEVQPPGASRRGRAATQSGRQRWGSEVHMARLSRVIGAESTERVRQSPSFPTLTGRLEALDRSGANTTAMVRSAAHQSIERNELGAKNPDPAASLVRNLDNGPRIDPPQHYERPRPHAGLQPSPEWQRQVGDRARDNREGREGQSQTTAQREAARMTSGRGALQREAGRGPERSSTAAREAARSRGGRSRGEGGPEIGF